MPNEIEAAHAAMPEEPISQEAARAMLAALEAMLHARVVRDGDVIDKARAAIALAERDE